MAWHRREHGCLVIVVKAYYKLCIDPSLFSDAAHACWEAIRLVVVDFPHAWTAHARDAAAGADGRHGDIKNAR